MTMLELERRFAKDPQTVFEYVTQTEHLLKWWGPEGVTIDEHQLDLTKEGPWGSVMVNRDGKQFKVTGEVVAIDPPHNVEFTWAWHDEFDVRGHESKVRFEIRQDSAGGTIFRLIHTGLADAEVSNNHNEGWSSSLNKLDQLAA